jgi:hypothetical protein
MHFLFSVYGVITVALVALFGGLQQGVGQEDWQQPWETPRPRLSLCGGHHLLLVPDPVLQHLLLHPPHLMWLRLGRRSRTRRCWFPPMATAPARTAKKATSTTPARVTPPPTDMKFQNPDFRISIPFLMSLRTFILGLSASFGIAWLAIIVVPYFKMRDLAPDRALDEAADGHRRLHPEARRPHRRRRQGLCRERLLPLPHPGRAPDLRRQRPLPSRIGAV